MKILLILIIVLFFKGCEYDDVPATCYVSSYHLAFEDDYYVGTFMFASNRNSTDHDYGVVKSKSLANLYTELEQSTELSINYLHISSIIFDESFLEKKHLDTFIDIIKHSSFFDFNFYVFASKDEASELYSFENPNSEGTDYTVLLLPLTRTYLYIMAPPMHFMDFVSAYLNDYNKTFIPVVSTNNIYNVKGEEAIGITLDAVCILDNEYQSEFVYYDSNKFLALLKSQEQYELFDDTFSVLLLNYKVKIDNKKLVITTDITKESSVSDDTLYNFLYTCIKEGLESDKSDYLNIEYYNYIYNKSIKKEDLSIELKMNIK